MNYWGEKLKTDAFVYRKHPLEGISLVTNSQVKSLEKGLNTIQQLIQSNPA
jgi:hypothetical protein